MKIFCIGRNYAAHAQELGNAVPDEPVVFIKPKSALLKPLAPFYYPEFTNELHYECELVLRVCKNGRYVQYRHAQQYYDAITLGIDFTARDIQNYLKQKGLPWEKAKAWDNSAVLGTWKPIRDFPNFKNINFNFYKNSELVQQGNSGQMIFNFNALVVNISKYFSLNIGDLIFTGTPAGVGETLPGDHLEAMLEDEEVLRIKVA